MSEDSPIGFNAYQKNDVRSYASVAESPDVDINRVVDELVSFTITDRNADAAIMTPPSNKSDSKFFPVTPKDDKKKVDELLERTGYPLTIRKFERVYGPPLTWSGPLPSPKCQLFVGHIPPTVREDIMVPLFEKFGQLYSIRLLRDVKHPERNRGFAFVMFTTRQAALEAERMLNGCEIISGWHITVQKSEPICQLYVGNIPKTATREAILSEANKMFNGVSDVTVYADPSDLSKNRGFCFINFETHANAMYAKKQLSTKRFFGQLVVADWADPVDEPDSSAMEKVRTLYVGNLDPSVTEIMLFDCFNKFGTIQALKRTQNYAFILFSDRNSALNAIKAMHGINYRGTMIDVSLAKPPKCKADKMRQLTTRRKRLTEELLQRYRNLLEKIKTETQAKTVITSDLLVKAACDKEANKMVQNELESFAKILSEVNRDFALGSVSDQDELSTLISRRIVACEQRLEKKLGQLKI